MGSFFYTDVDFNFSTGGTDDSYDGDSSPDSNGSRIAGLDFINWLPSEPPHDRTEPSSLPTFSFSSWEEYCDLRPTSHSFTEGVDEDRVHGYHSYDSWDRLLDYPGVGSSEHSALAESINLGFDADILNDFEIPGLGTLNPRHTPTGWIESLSAQGSRTESVFSSHTGSSCECTAEEQAESASIADGQSKDQQSQGELSVVQFLMSSEQDTTSMAPETIGSGRKAKGRKKPLEPRQKEEAARMRRVGACDSCRRRRAKCDDGLHCQSCIRYHKNRLLLSPCRGKSLESLADSILGDMAFPRGKPLQRFLGSDHLIEPNEHFVYLNLGFGPHMAQKAQIVRSRSGNCEAFIHKHVVYPWQPKRGEQPVQSTEVDVVFPAILSDADGLETALENHLRSLLENPQNFKHFPLWISPLQVLRRIYVYYKSLPEPDKKPLRQALTLLILVHIGGDTSILHVGGASKSILNHLFPDHAAPSKATPCFIRGQLGPIYCKLANHHMRAVLSQLESLSLTRDCEKFPLILSTFAVLFMAVESLQYHRAKEPYHAHLDNPIHGPMPQEMREIDEGEGPHRLLQFYKACFPGCHAQLQDLAEGFPLPGSWTGSGYATNSVDYFNGLRDAIEVARSYLMEKKELNVASKDDMSCFFDRLLGKLFLMA